MANTKPLAITLTGPNQGLFVGLSEGFAKVVESGRETRFYDRNHHSYHAFQGFFPTPSEKKVRADQNLLICYRSATWLPLGRFQRETLIGT